MLPLLREQEGSGTSTAEERVIGAGLQAIEKKKDGVAVQALFHMFAVTQVSDPLHIFLFSKPMTCCFCRRILCIQWP